MWVLDSKEPRGMIRDKIWLKNTSTNRRALFKPDTEERESEKSMVFYQVCVHLGISCAKTELYEYNGRKGCLSHDVGQRRFIANEAAELDIKSGSSVKNGVLAKSEVSYTDIESRLSESAKIKFADMVYVDVLLRNTDRHSGNFKLLIDQNNRIVDMLGLYDNDQILGGELAEISYFKWDTEISEPMYEIIKKPYKVFPERIKKLLNKSRELPKTLKYYDIITERLKKIYINLGLNNFVQ